MPIKVKIRDAGLECEVRELPTPEAKISTANQLNVDISDSPKFIGKIRSVFSFGGAVNVLNFLCRFIAAKAQIFIGHKARPSTAPAKLIEVDSSFRMDKEAKPSTAPAKGIEVDQKEKVSVYAKLVAYRRAGCRYIKKLFFKRKAELKAAPGAVAKYAKAVKLNRTSKAVAADSAIMESRFNTIAHSYEAAGSSAPSKAVPVTESKFTVNHTAQASTAAVVPVNIDSLQKVTHSAKMATWLEPYVEDGVLYLRQAHTAEKSGNKLVVR